MLAVLVCYSSVTEKYVRIRGNKAAAGQAEILAIINQFFCLQNNITKFLSLP